MALIKCPECNHDVSDKAPQCLNCGFIINQQETKRVDLNVNNYELTSKKWKKHYAWGIPLLIIGIPIFSFNLMSGVMSSATGVDTGASAGWFFIGLIFCIVGGINFLIAAIGSWWDRG